MPSSSLTDDYEVVCKAWGVYKTKEWCIIKVHMNKGMDAFLEAFPHCRNCYTSRINKVNYNVWIQGGILAQVSTLLSIRNNNRSPQVV